MEYVQAVVLGAVQGLTEFIPVSSDGHLFLIRQIFRWSDQGLAFDAVLHLGTLLVVVVGLWREWLGVLRGLGSILKTRKLWSIPEQRLVVLLVVATIPAALAGFFLESILLRPLEGWSLLVCGLQPPVHFIFLQNFLQKLQAVRTSPFMTRSMRLKQLAAHNRH